MSVRDLHGFFDEADKPTTIEELSQAFATKRISGLVRKDLAALLR
jgi:hypothetical protein